MNNIVASKMFYVKYCMHVKCEKQLALSHIHNSSCNIMFLVNLIFSKENQFSYWTSFLVLRMRYRIDRNVVYFIYVFSFYLEDYCRQKTLYCNIIHGVSLTPHKILFLKMFPSSWFWMRTHENIVLIKCQRVIIIFCVRSIFAILYWWVP